ncbi:MAG: cell division topological specificity factor MinE [Campylobacterales bacterium]
MSLWEKIFGSEKKSASTARDRLTMVLAHERASVAIENIDAMKAELMQVIRKYVPVKDIKIKSEKNQNIDILEFEIFIGNR